MKIIEPSARIISEFNGEEVLKLLEMAGRTAYKSEDRVTSDSARAFIAGIIKSGHGSVIEHFNISVRVVCDRGVSHEIVRHRLGSFTQESTRYVNYGSARFGSEITFIRPCFWQDAPDKTSEWESAMKYCEEKYLSLIKLGAAPQEARSVLPTSLKTELVWTANLREWRHTLKLRISKKAHPQMRQIMLPLLKEFQSKIPAVFDDIQAEE